MRNFAKIYNAMNNKIIIILSVLTAFLVTSCKETHNKAIDIAYQLTATAPDSALSVLDGVDQAKLGKAEMARYALVYTIAQDKSGLDVDNDSLLRTAYTYYNNREDDSLYAKCEYYMGKYYMLNDSTELAEDCLQNAANASEKQGDKYTLCLALEKLSKVLSNLDSRRSVSLAKRAERIYGSLSNATITNKIYYKLNVCEALLFDDSLELADRECKEAFKQATLLRDSLVLSDVYQDLASINRKCKNYTEALWYAKKAYDLSNNNDWHKLLNLAWAYMNVDSLEECNKLLLNCKTKSTESLYTSYYIRHLAAIKEHNYANAVSFADSAYHYIEEMYGDELIDKEKYYKSLVAAQYEKGISEGRANLLTWLVALIVFSAIAVIAFILYAYRQYKLRAERKIQREQEKRTMEKKMNEEEIRHKEIQLSTMRSFILRRIDTAQKIQELRGNKTDTVPLTEEDWEEIRLFVDGVEGNFVSRLHSTFPDLSDDDIRLMMLLRLKMPTKALALIYGISEKSIKQKLFVYKAKVGISGEKVSLRTFIEAF